MSDSRASYGSDMSIDDDVPPSPQPRREHASSQPPDNPVRRAFSRESSVESEAGKKTSSGAAPEKESKDETSTPDQVQSIQASQPSRRLSVQDRINMFESKQKENSSGKPVELRRLSSDVSEKAVFRRWSGASDMSISIDLSSEKKDIDSPACNTAPAATSLEFKFSTLIDNNAEVSSAAKPDMKVLPSSGGVGDGGTKGVSFSTSERLIESNNKNFNLGSSESGVLKDQQRGKTQSRSFVNRVENQEKSEDDFKAPDIGRDKGVTGFGNQGKAEVFSGGKTQMTGFKDQVLSSSHTRRMQIKSGQQSEGLEQSESSESRDESGMEVMVKSAQKSATGTGVVDGGAGSRILQAFASRYKGIEGDSSSAQQDVRSVRETEAAEKKETRMFEKASREVTPSVKTEVPGKKESHISEKVSDSHVSNLDDSGPQRLKFNRQVLTAELNKRTRIQRVDASSSGNSRLQFSGQVTAEVQEGSDSFSTPTNQAQRVRQAKGNQELDDLKIKASELEKMFAEHKLRLPGDQSNSARKGRLIETPHEPSSSSHYTKPIVDDNYQSAQPSRISKNSTKFDTASPMKAVDSQYDSDAMNTQFSDLSVTDSSRGKLYDRYMQKRDAKLREDWSANREEKEARLKSMQDSIERNRSEMKAKFSGSVDNQDHVSSAHRRVERIRSYNSRSIMKREQVDL